MTSRLANRDSTTGTDLSPPLTPAPGSGRERWRCGPHRWRVRPTPDIPRTRSLTKGRGERTGEGDGTGAHRPGPPGRALRPAAAALRTNHPALRRPLRAHRRSHRAPASSPRPGSSPPSPTTPSSTTAPLSSLRAPLVAPAGGDRRARRAGLGHRTGGPPGLGLRQVGAAALGRRAHRRPGPGRSGPPGPRAPRCAVTTGIDALDGYFSRYLPQLFLAVIVPVTIIAVVAGADWSRPC